MSVFTTNNNKENTYRDYNGKIFRFLNSFLQESVDLRPPMIVGILFCKLKKCKLKTLLSLFGFSFLWFNYPYKILLSCDVLHISCNTSLKM